MSITIETLKRVVFGLLGQSIASEIDHGERLKTAAQIREIETLLRAARESGDEQTARYLEQCLREAGSANAVRNALDYAATLEIEPAGTTVSGQPNFLRALPESERCPRGRRPKSRGAVQE
jgi:hypothetical protein